MIRTYPLKHSINAGKQEKIIAVAKEYRKLAVKVAALQWEEFYCNGDFDKNADIKALESVLSERYKQTCQYQVVGVLESFIANRQKEFVRMVWHSSLDKETRHRLFYINKRELWFATQVKMRKNDKGKQKEEKANAMEKAKSDVARLEERLKAFEEGLREDPAAANEPLVVEMIIKTQEALERAKGRLADLQKEVEKENKGEQEDIIPEETLKLARAIFKHILKKHRRPSLHHCNLALDNKVAKIHPCEKSKYKRAKKFDYWITFSTGEPRQTIFLPLSANGFFEEKTGCLKNFCQINIAEDEQITVCLIKDVEKREYIPETPQIALDFGLRNLFATNNGDLYGRDFIEVLKKYDIYITSLSSNRQRQGMNIKSPAYNSLVSLLRNFLKNEINRVIDRIIENYHPKEIVVESLNFTSPLLSRQLNRILSNAGRKILQKKFDSIAEEFDIVITEVPAPYTSQECSVCGYVDEHNRPTQSTFFCRHCHTKLNADVNGARNILSRSSTKELCNVYLGKEAVLDILIRQFLQSHPDIYNSAPDLLDKNPYFRQGRKYVVQYG